MFVRGWIRCVTLRYCAVFSQAISKLRVRVEHAIGRVKMFCALARQNKLPVKRDILCKVLKTMFSLYHMRTLFRGPPVPVQVGPASPTLPIYRPRGIRQEPRRRRNRRRRPPCSAPPAPQRRRVTTRRHGETYSAVWQPVIQAAIEVACGRDALPMPCSDWLVAARRSHRQWTILLQAYGEDFRRRNVHVVAFEAYQEQGHIPASVQEGLLCRPNSGDSGVTEEQEAEFMQACARAGPHGYIE